MAELSREQILRCQKAEPLSLELLYRTYQLKVARLVFRFVGKGEDAKDLV